MLYGINYLYNFPIHRHYDHFMYIFSLLHVDDVRFSLNGTPYQNNSLVTLEDIGEGVDALFCITNQIACCRQSYTGEMVFGNWFFPNGTRVPSHRYQWDFYRTRGQMVVQLHHRRGGEEGIYHCEIHDAMNVTQTIYIGVYTAGSGKV